MGLEVGFGTLNCTARLLLGLGAAFLLQLASICAGAQTAATGEVREPPAAGAVDDLPDEFIILDNVNDFSEFLKKLKQPDWIFLRPGRTGNCTSRRADCATGG